MARRKAPKDPTPIQKGRQKLVLMGDVRQAPVELREGARTFKPVVALWVRADDGYVVGQSIDEPGHPAQTLVQALRSPVSVPGQPQTAVLPSRVVLFNEVLARQVKALLAPLNIEVMVSPPFEQFDDLFDDLFASLQEGGDQQGMLDMPDDVLRPLISAAERLWLAKPWGYTFDYPPFSLVPNKDNARPLYASVLGANKEVFGVALYTALEDYKAMLELDGSMMGPPPDNMLPAALDAVTTEILQVLHHRSILVSFDSKGEVPSTYREQLARCGWSRRLSMVPTFAEMGGSVAPTLLTATEAAEVILAVDSLVTFCQRHRKQIVDEEFPIRDTVEVSLAGKTERVAISVPAEDPAAPPATVYRFKVSLSGKKDVWRRIEVRSDQTLEDLHYAIQKAFGWDDDHLYAFFLSGKAWDASTEYVRPEGQGPGNRVARVRLDRLALRPRKRFVYIFDFGDEWRHDILLEKAGLVPTSARYPRIVEEHGEAPPQYGDEEDDYEEEDGEEEDE